MLWVAGPALSEPSGTVRRVIYPVVGGETTLEPWLRRLRRTKPVQGAGSHSAVVVVLGALAANALAAAGCAGAGVQQPAYRPVMDAIDLLKLYPKQPLKEGRSSIRHKRWRLRG
ncbi:hypothetical protein [Embleya sp. NPDC020886]|uniref:hypothetical protein n=1 Tax=Embleya sp. NPDC020886 TaxID=3363980 RepID=UPI00378FD41B